MTDNGTRKVIANLSISIDGRYHGAGGPADFGAFVPYVTSDTARDHMARMIEHATTAVLGRVNAEGFLGFWPSVADDENADPRDRAYAEWLVETEKVVLSSTLTEAPWERATIANAPTAEVVAGLKESGTGDILANTSPTVIKALLEADLVDRLYLLVIPEIAGGGERLFEDGLPASRWALAEQHVGRLGEMALVYDRAR